MNSKELITPGFNKTKNDDCVKGNQEQIAKYKKGFLSAEKYNKGKLITPSNEYFSADETIFRDFNSTLI